jgi:hypothetical protein
MEKKEKNNSYELIVKNVEADRQIYHYNRCLSMWFADKGEN